MSTAAYEACDLKKLPHFRGMVYASQTKKKAEFGTKITFASVISVIKTTRLVAAARTLFPFLQYD